MLLLDRCGHLHAYPRSPFRNDRVPETRDEHTLVEQAPRELDRERGLADDDRDDRPLAVERLEPDVAQPAAKLLRLAAQLRHQLRLPAEHPPGPRRSPPTAWSAEQATVGGSALEKSCGRERWARMSQPSSLAATKPPAAPPSALPSVEVITSTSPSSP